MSGRVPFAATCRAAGGAGQRVAVTLRDLNELQATLAEAGRAADGNANRLGCFGVLLPSCGRGDCPWKSDCGNAAKAGADVEGVVVVMVESHSIVVGESGRLG